MENVRITQRVANVMDRVAFFRTYLDFGLAWRSAADQDLGIAWMCWIIRTKKSMVRPTMQSPNRKQIVHMISSSSRKLNRSETRDMIKQVEDKALPWKSQSGEQSESDLVDFPNRMYILDKLIWIWTLQDCSFTIPNNKNVHGAT